MRRAAGRVRVNAQLIDAETGTTSGRNGMIASLEDVFAVQDEITEALTTAICPAVADAELRRAFANRQRTLEHGKRINAAFGTPGRPPLRTTNRRLISFDVRRNLITTFASPHAMLAYYYGWGFASGGIRQVHEISKVAEEHARRAVQLDPDDPDCAGCAILVVDVRWRHCGALERVGDAILAAPSDAVAWIAKARVLAVLG